jgi:hypothetical protein
MPHRARTHLVALALATACEAAGPARGEDDDARALLDEVRRDHYERWSSEVIEGSAPHGRWSVVFVDAQLEAARAGPSLEAWPDEVTIVCEGRDEAEGEAELVMIMRKQDDAWLWAQLEPDGRPLVYGRAVGCVHCHAAGQDFTRAIDLP